MADWEILVHKAIAALYREIPTASKSSVSLQIKKIKVQFLTSTKSILDKQKKKVPLPESDEIGGD